MIFDAGCGGCGGTFAGRWAVRCSHYWDRSAVVGALDLLEYLWPSHLMGG